jgi:molybdopterin converting factor small subunit
VKVTVVCFGALRDYLPEGTTGNSAPVELHDGARVNDVIGALGAPRGLVHALLVDGMRATPDRELSNGVEVTLMPPFTGG